MRHFTRSWLCGLAVASLTAFATGSAHAAVRLCPTFIVGQGTAATELEAKKQAMDDWKKSAIAAGIEDPAWRIAFNKSFECEPKDGQITCTASGNPCTIVQVPPSSTVSQ